MKKIKEIAEKLKENLQYGMSTTLTPDEAHNLILYIEEKEKDDVSLPEAHECKYCGAMTRQSDDVCYMKPKAEVVNVPDSGNYKWREGDSYGTHA